MKSQSALAQSPQELTRDPLLKLSEVGEELRLTEKAVRHLIDGGQLQAYRMAGRRLRVKRSDLDRFLATQLQPT